MVIIIYILHHYILFNTLSFSSFIHSSRDVAYLLDYHYYYLVWFLEEGTGIIYDVDGRLSDRLKHSSINNMRNQSVIKDITIQFILSQRTPFCIVLFPYIFIRMYACIFESSSHFIHRYKIYVLSFIQQQGRRQKNDKRNQKKGQHESGHEGIDRI